MDRLSLKKLRVSGLNKADAELTFGERLTLITGISNTGKSHVLECVDFALGSGDRPREFDEAVGYDQVRLEFQSGETLYTIRRSFNDADQAALFEGRMDDWDDEGAEDLPVKISPKKPETTLTGRLLTLCGFDPEATVVRNQKGQSQALSFRTIAPFVLIEESEVISKGSPILPASVVQQTAARSVFRILLTGSAPTAEEIAAIQASHQQKEQARQKVSLLEPIIDGLRAEISDVGLRRADLDEEIERIDNELSLVSDAVTKSGDQVRVLMDLRNSALADADEAARVGAEARELGARFRLLAEHYASDVRRLEFVLEGGHFFQQLSASHCPHCGQQLDTDWECHPESDSFEQIERASRAEIKKLRPRMADLKDAIDDSEVAAARASAQLRASSSRADTLDGDIRDVANPTAEQARDRVRVIADRRREVEGHLLRYRELDRYIATRQEAAVAADQKADRYKNEQSLVELRSLQDAVGALLRNWKFPLETGVQFSLQTDDLVIDGKERSANGKGVRAVTHAAFTLGLMHHCATAETPHPGFAIIDSPLTPFRGVRDDEEDPELQQDVHAAFLQSLAAEGDKGQAIIIENVDPPTGLDENATVHLFTGSADGRRGFYPT